MPKQRRARIRLLAAERSELERLVAARTSTQQAAYRAEIILRVADGQTEVWTGTDLAGGVSGYCTQSGKDWGSMAATNPGTPMVGHLDVTNATWTDAYLQTCDRTNVRLYCFERCP